MRLRIEIDNKYFEAHYEDEGKVTNDMRSIAHMCDCVGIRNGLETAFARLLPAEGSAGRLEEAKR